MIREAKGRSLGSEPSAPQVLVASYLLGSVPVANIISRLLRGVDLRDVGNGTVSGTGLYNVAGFAPLAVAGCLELAKGAAGPLIAGGRRTALRSVAAAVAVAGHNWSPFLRFSGGRGLSVAMGGLLVIAPEGTALIGAGLGAGRLARETGLSSLASVLGLPLLLWRTRGRSVGAGAALLLMPILGKRLAGNGRPEKMAARTYVNRLLFDSDTHAPDPLSAGLSFG